MQRSRSVLLIPLAALIALSACSREPASTASSPTASAVSSADALQRAGSDEAPLRAGQSVQGYIEADVGEGVVRFRSLATRVADDVGEQVARGMATERGRKAVEDANRKLEALGTDAQVDPQALAHSLAGKTFHDAAVRDMQVKVGGRVLSHKLMANLQGEAVDGRTFKLELAFDPDTRALQSATVASYPRPGSLFDFYEGDAEVHIERFERNADGSFALAGTFTASDLKPSAMAKKLAGTQLAQVSGRFDYAALPAKSMPGLGG